MNLKKVLLATVVIWLVGTVFSFLTCGWLFNWVYTIPPDIWKDPTAMMSGANMIGSNVVGIARSLIFVSVYAWLLKSLPGKGINKGLNYGMIAWLVGAVSGMASMPFYMTISTTVVVYWIIQALVLNLINGVIVAKIYKEGR